MGIETRGDPVHHGRDLRRMGPEGFGDRPQIPDEDAGVPEIVAGRQVGLRQFERRLFLEGSHFQQAGRVRDARLLQIDVRVLTGADVAIPRLRARRLDADRDHGVIVRREIQGRPDDAAELRHVQHQGVGRRHHDIGFRMADPDLPAGVSDAGCGVAGAGFGQDILRRDVGQLLTDDADIGLGSDDPDMLRRAECPETVRRQLDQRPAAAQHVDELLRQLRRRHRPKAGAYASRHDYHVTFHPAGLFVKHRLIAGDRHAQALVEILLLLDQAEDGAVRRDRREPVGRLQLAVLQLADRGEFVIPVCDVIQLLAQGVADGIKLGQVQLVALDGILLLGSLAEDAAGRIHVVVLLVLLELGLEQLGPHLDLLADRGLADLLEGVEFQIADLTHRLRDLGGDGGLLLFILAGTGGKSQAGSSHQDGCKGDNTMFHIIRVFFCLCEYRKKAGIS